MTVTMREFEQDLDPYAIRDLLRMDAPISIHSAKGEHEILSVYVVKEKSGPRICIDIDGVNVNRKKAPKEN